MNLTVRMYNTGFGDCFLLTIPAPDRPRKVLIDCGKHMLSRTGPPLPTIVDQLLTDIIEDGGPRVDVLVATHRHQDHVSGFEDPRWSDVQVAEVWMPWTEHPDDPVARDICDRQSARAAFAQRGIAALGLETTEQAYLLGYAGNNLKNAAAMNLLHGGFRGAPRRRFLPTPDPTERVIRTEVLPGIEAHVLGPPRDPQVMREMDPPDSESFLRALSGKSPPPGAGGAADVDDDFLLTREQYIASLNAGQKAPVPDDPLADFPREEEDGLARLLDDSTMALLTRLEQAVNSTSLVLLFHVGSAWLLFAADAQWGTWNAILNDPTRAKLLENVTFYKVGHHGSHNATPISFVERYVGSQVKVMMPYGKVDRWPTIPRQGLLAALTQKGIGVLRSDQLPPTGIAHRMAGADVLSIDLELPFAPDPAPAPIPPRTAAPTRARSPARNAAPRTKRSR